MLKDKKIAFIGGGNMATALVRGLLHSKEIAPTHVGVSDVSPERLETLEDEHGIVPFQANDEAARWADVVVVAVKPQIVDRVLPEVRGGLQEGDLVVSVAAGVSLELLERGLTVDGKVPRVIRAMPNTAAIVLAGATAISAGRYASRDDLAVAKSIFDAVGKTVILDESLLDAVTGLSGSGPAYVMVMIEALADGGVKVGLGRDVALLLAAQTVFGAAKLQLETGEHPGRLKDQVTSPGGTAIAGLHTLEAGGLRRTLIDAVEAASTRSAELGEKLAERFRAG